jgi:hypothetical protein
MSTITIDGTEYAEEALSSEAKAELVSMQVCDQRVATMQTDLRIAQTARNAYANALNSLLPKAAAPKAKPTAKPKAKAKKS